MKVSYNRLVERDVQLAMRYYAKESGWQLAEDFYQEFDARVSEIAGNPKRFHFEASGLRRANLKRFPYHILYRERLHDIRILVVNHDRRHPRYGMDRV